MVRWNLWGSQERQWFEDYLNDQYQAVKVNDELSGWERATCGVPQGSPLLFLIYINDIGTVVKRPYILFTDDTVIYTSDENYEKAVNRLQENVDNFMIWTKGSALTVNASKSKTMSIMPFNSRKKREQIKGSTQMKMVETKMEEVESYKFLGVYIDEELSFNTHIWQVIKNVAHKIHILCKIRPYVTRNASLDIYRVMILPLLDFGDIFYHGATQNLLNKIESLQKRAIHIVPCLPRMLSVGEELTRYKLLPLNKRRKLHLAQIARWMAGKGNYIDQKTGNTRSYAEGRTKLKVLYPRKNKVKRCFMYQATTIWNDLPTSLHRVVKPDEFKREFLNHMTVSS